MWERQKCQGADRRKTRHERKRRSENEGGGAGGGGGGPYEGESLMEMDLTKVEIRWGNCEKMAGVLTRGCNSGRGGRDPGCKKHLRMFDVWSQKGDL